jgi:hypothetical protein
MVEQGLSKKRTLIPFTLPSILNHHSRDSLPTRPSSHTSMVAGRTPLTTYTYTYTYTPANRLLLANAAGARTT